MHPLRLYHGSPLFAVYAVSCITLTLLVAHVWQACVVVVAVHGFWFVARLWVDSLLHTVTNSISFRHLQACHSRWAPCHLPQVLLCLCPWLASCISQVLVRPHLGHPTIQALFHLGARPPLHMLAQPLNSTSTLGLILSPFSNPIPHRLVNRNQVGSAGVSLQPTGRFPRPHLAIYPCPSPPKAEGGSLPQFLGVLFLCILLLFWHLMTTPGKCWPIAG